jgi:RNA polymerase sigma-70 factor (ECF subfamily)
MSAIPDDVSLMLRYREGDLEAFETLYRRHQDSLYRYLLRLSVNRDVAEDVFQDVWTRIIKSRRNYRATAQFKTFLFRVARNCFIDHVRRNKRHMAASAGDPDSYAASGEAPDASAERSLARRRLEIALCTLPEEQRDVFLLYEEGGFDIGQIAGITGVKQETAKSRLRYAKKKLQAALQAGEPGSES